MTIIHMSVEDVRALAGSIQAQAYALREAFDGLKQSVYGMGWQGGSYDDFTGQVGASHQSALALADQLVALAQNLENEVQQWEGVAAVFCNAHGGSGVLGISSATAPVGLTQPVDQLSWQARWTELQRLQAELALLKANNPHLDAETAAKKIAELDAQIAGIERNMAEIMGEPEKWYNKWFKQDGKSLADQYQSTISDYQRQIDDLKGLRGQYEAEIVAANQAALLQTDIDALNNKLSVGIAPDGPTRRDIKNYYTGCTNYVAGKRDVLAFSEKTRGHAYQWNDMAIKAGFDVGKAPVKGSIMVFEADGGKKNGIMNVHDEYGHVAYVEEVNLVNGVYEVKYSHGGWTKGVTKQGSYDPLKGGTVKIAADGHDSVSFIYEKPQ